MEKENFNALIEKAKEKQIKVQIQKIVPVEEKKKEIIFSLYIPAENLKSLKIMSAEQGISIKNLINEAINEKYFK